MATAASGPDPAPATIGDGSLGLSRILDVIARAATSWLGLLTAYAAAVTGAVVAFQKLPDPLKRLQLWQQVALLAALPVLALVFHAIPTLVDQRRRKRLSEVTGVLHAGYFRLGPRDEQSLFTRADGQHEEILHWLEKRSYPVCYLTGLSGSGKSSLLSSWVLPKLEAGGTLVIRLRGYQDPIGALEQELQKPDLIWEKPSGTGSSTRALIERACRHVRPRRILVVLDQFEEFVILQDHERQTRFREFLSELQETPVGDVAFLFVFRSDYIGLIEGLGLPPLDQSSNWREVPPFSEGAALEFLRGSGLQVSDDLLRGVLREAAEIEQAKGLIRPITINLCGLVIGRFATGLPRGFRPGGLIRGFLRESVSLPSVRDIAPGLIPHLISNYVTKRPRSVLALARDTGFDPAEIRGCLRVLGHRDRAIVRSLDADQQNWEISHDFLVPLLDSIFSRWTVSILRRCRPWFPWVAAVTLAVAVAAASTWRKNPIAELTELGWNVGPTQKGLMLDIKGDAPKGSGREMKTLDQPLLVKLRSVERLDESVSELRNAKNLTSLDLSNTRVSDVSPLKDLKSLYALNLDNTEVSDVSPVKELGNLISLGLSNTRVSDVSPLKDLKNLTDLSLDSRQVSDVSPLKDLKNLTDLSLEGTRVSDVSPLKDLTNLTQLSLEGTRVSDVSPLKDLTNLTVLYLGGTEVTDVSPLRDLKKLATLYLDSTRVSDISPLKDLKNMTNLRLEGTRVSDVSPLKDLKNMGDLFLSSSRVSDVWPLKDLKNLFVLDLISCRVTDVSPLKDLKNLTSLDLSNTRVSDVSPLKDLRNLNALNLNHTEVSDVSPLKDLKNLTELSLEGTRVSDVSPLKDLKNLTSLVLSNTRVSDVSPLKDLKNLVIVRK